VGPPREWSLRLSRGLFAPAAASGEAKDIKDIKDCKDTRDTGGAVGSCFSLVFLVFFVLYVLGVGFLLTPPTYSSSSRSSSNLALDYAALPIASEAVRSCPERAR